MKRFFTLLTALLLTTASVSAQTAYAIWCAGLNGANTLYFDYTTANISVGSTYDTHYVINVWSGDDVLNFKDDEYPEWTYDIMERVTRVVFKESFSQVEVQKTKRWFFNCKALMRIDGLNFLNTSKVTNMGFMFAGCTALKRLDLSTFDTSNVTSMNNMFVECSSLTNLDVSNFNTSSVTDMSYMFYNCSSLTNLDLSGFNTSNVTNMKSMFYGCSSLSSLDISRFNTSSVTNMSGLFRGCSSLTDHDVSKLNTSKVTDMSYMFYDCSSLTALDLSGFNTSKVTDMSYMFYNCSSLTALDVSKFNTTSVTDMSRIFYGCSSLTGLDVNGFNTSKVTNLSYMFYGCSSLTGLDVNGFNTSKVTNMSDMFYDCSSLAALDVSNFITSSVTNLSDMFYGCSSLTGIDVSKFNTSKVTNMSGMFSKCNFTTLDVNGFDTSKVTNMSYVFSNCSSLTSLDLSTFDTSKVTTMYAMFRDCSSLTSLDVSNFNTSKVTTMSYMFGDCSSLTSLDVSNFNTSKVTSISNMFNNCSSLKTIYCDDSWNAAESTLMFFNCTSLAGAVAYDSSMTDAQMANPTTGYFTKKAPSGPTAYAIWCQGNKTLYFDYTTTSVTAGSTYDGQTVTSVWSGDDVLTSQERLFPYWIDINELVVKVVFKKSFSQAEVLKTLFWFYNCQALKSIDGLNFLNTSKVNNMGGMFSGCSSLASLDVSNFDTSNVISMSSMFYNCSSLKSLDVSNFNTSSVKYMNAMFYGCSSLTVLDVSGFDTSNVTDMNSMFDMCSSLTSLDLSNFDTSNVTDMSYMFYKCSSLTSLDVSNFDTSNVTTMSYMFYDCSSLKTIYCNDTWSAESSGNMFTGCTTLVGAVSYNLYEIGVSMANPDTGYFTRLALYNLWLCGKQVSSFNCADLTVIKGVTVSSEDGYVRYDPETKTLELRKARISCDWAPPLKNKIPSLTVQCGAPEYENDPEISYIQCSDVNATHAMDVGASTIVTGTDPLWILGGYLFDYKTPAVYLSGGNLTIWDANVTIMGTDGIDSKILGFAPLYSLLVRGISTNIIIIASEYVSKGLKDLIKSRMLAIVEPLGAQFSKYKFLVGSDTVKEGSILIRCPYDVNLDRKVDINDVVAIINTMAGNSTYKSYANANLDPDGIVDINDVVAVINIMAGK